MNIVEAVLNGSIIEDYADVKRMVSMWETMVNDSHRNPLACRV